MMSSLSLEASAPSADGPSIKSLPGMQSLEGYEYEFDPPVDSRFECPICLLVLREPSQTKCGHRFCKDCILRTLKNSSSRCPIDNEQLTEADIYPDNYAKREILNCTIKCPNKEGGCEKVFPLCELKAHLQVCLFTLVPCPNKCGCILPRRDIDNHIEKACGLRIVMCTCCGANIYAQLTQEHVMVCPKVPVQCENCHNEMTRDMLKLHLQTACENVTVFCPFYSLGCTASLKRCSEDQHLMEEGATHLRQLCGAVTHILGQMNSKRQHMGQIAQNSELSNGSLPSRMADSGAWLTDNASSSGLNQAMGDGKDRNLNPSQPVELDQSHTSNARLSVANFVPNSGGVPQQTISSQQREPQVDLQHPNSLPTAAVNSKFVQKAGASSLPFIGVMANPSNGETIKGCVSQTPSLPDQENSISSAASGLAASVASLSLYSQGDTQQKHLSPNQSACGVPDSWPGSATDAANTIPLVFAMMEQVTATFDQKLRDRNKDISELKATVLNLRKQNVELSRALVGLQENILSKTCHGKFYWKIPDFSRHKLLALQGEQVVFHSQAFYTSPWGYKMCLRASITAPKTSEDGPSKPQHLSLFIHVMQGDNDSFLPWPFNGKILLALLDQNKNEAYRKPVQETIEAKPSLAAFQRPVQPRNQKGFGFTDFMPVDKIEGGTYLANDCLLVHAHVFTSV